MTDEELLDHFAGQALIGIVERLNHDAIRRYRSTEAQPFDGRDAIAAYRIADTMMAERKRRKAA